MAEKHSNQLPAGQIDESTPLGKVKDWLRARVGKGEKCPCCGQRAQVYRRKLNKTMVRTLALLAIEQKKQSRPGFLHAPTVLKAHAGYAREVGKLAYWNLVIEGPTKRGDGGHAGMWQVSSDGFAFLRGQLEVKRYAKVYDGRKLGSDGPWVNINEVADEFDLKELLEGI